MRLTNVPGSSRLTCRNTFNDRFPLGGGQFSRLGGDSPPYPLSPCLQYSPPLQFRNAGAYLGVSGKLLLGVVVGVKGGALEKFYK